MPNATGASTGSRVEVVHPLLFSTSCKGAVLPFLGMLGAPTRACTYVPMVESPPSQSQLLNLGIPLLTLHPT